jgi:hypothetical protein
MLAMENSYSNILGFFMVSFWIREEPLSPFLKNIIIDLLSASGMTFLLLQNRWMNSCRDSPFFCTMLARYQLTPERAHVAWKLSVNSRHNWFEERTDPVGSPKSQVRAEDDKQTGK